MEVLAAAAEALPVDGAAAAAPGAAPGNTAKKRTKLEMAKHRVDVRSKVLPVSLPHQITIERLPQCWLALV